MGTHSSYRLFVYDSRLVVIVILLEVSGKEEGVVALLCL